MNLDFKSAIPLYHQIAEELRRLIAAGDYKPGEILPGLHDAAAQWGVNLHTVRRAYKELADQGLVETRRPRGTMVLPLPTADGKAPEAKKEDLGSFIEDIARMARVRHRLSLDELAGLLTGSGEAIESEEGVVFVVEDSRRQARELAAQVEASFNVEAFGWRLDRSGPPPPGPIIGTYFHFNDIRRRWPRRRTDLNFVSVTPDPRLIERVKRLIERYPEPVVTVCDNEQPAAETLAADLIAHLDETVRVEAASGRQASGLANGGSSTGPVLFSAMMWDSLDEEAHTREGIFEMRYVFEDDELARVARTLGWRPK